MRIWWRQTTWVVLVPITTHIPNFIDVAYTELWIFDFLLLANQNRYANKVLNMPIWWWQITWVVLVPITTHLPSQCSPYRTLDFWPFLLLANQNKYANEVLNMCSRWRQTTWVVLVPITTHIPSFINVAHRELWIFEFFLLANQNKYANMHTCAPHYPHTKFDKNHCVLIRE